MFNRRLQASALLCLGLLGSANASDEFELQDALSVAKFAGACGILKSMSQFQNATRMEGGSEFIERFWSTESARLGKTPEQYIADCNRFIEAYERLWAASE